MSAGFNQIISFLKELDFQLPPEEQIQLYLIGGSAITLLYDKENRTADLDLVDPPDLICHLGGPKSSLAKKYLVYVSPVPEINFSVPQNWKSKCEPIDLDLRHISVLIPCLEDIILGKLARLEPKDFEDILSLHEKKLLDPKKLIARLNENKKELRKLAYRNNVKLLFKELFHFDLSFKKGDLKLKKRR